VLIQRLGCLVGCLWLNQHFCMQRQHSSQTTSILGNTPNLNTSVPTTGNTTLVPRPGIWRETLHRFFRQVVGVRESDGWQRSSESLFLTPALFPKKMTPAPVPAPELTGNLHSETCLHSKSLKAESILPHERERERESLLAQTLNNFMQK